MADISNYLRAIEGAARGEEVRDAILGALNTLNTEGSTAYTLNGHPSSYFAKQDDMDKILPLDSEPVAGSTRAVSSGGLYNYMMKVMNAIDTINGEVI